MTTWTVIAVGYLAAGAVFAVLSTREKWRGTTEIRTWRGYLAAEPTLHWLLGWAALLCMLPVWRQGPPRGHPLHGRAEPTTLYHVEHLVADRADRGAERTRRRRDRRRWARAILGRLVRALLDPPTGGR